MLYDAILIAGHGIKAKLSLRHNSVATAAYGLPDLEDLIRRTCNTLYTITVGELKSSMLQTYVQAIMLLAWHELVQGLIR